MTVITGTSLTDILNGTSSSDTISGLGGSDTLSGLAGNDTLIGGTANDTLDGGEDSDIYQIGLHDGFDIFSDTGTIGWDQIQAAFNDMAIGLKSGFGPISGIE